MWFVGSEKPCIYSVPNRKQSYEKEKIITVPLPESFFKMTTEEKLQYLASLDMNKGNTKIELTLNPGTLPDDPVVEEYKKLDN